MEPFVSDTPYLNQLQLTQDDEFIILACTLCACPVCRVVRLLSFVAAIFFLIYSALSLLCFFLLCGCSFSYFFLFSFR